MAFEEKKQTRAVQFVITSTLSVFKEVEAEMYRRAMWDLEAKDMSVEVWGPGVDDKSFPEPIYTSGSTGDDVC